MHLGLPVTAPFPIPDHTDPGMSNMDEEKKLQGSLSNGSAGGQEEEAGSNNNIEIWKPVTQMRDWNV